MAKRRTTTERERSDRFMHNIRYYRRLLNSPALTESSKYGIRTLLAAEYERYNYACKLCTLDYIGVRKGSWEYHILNDRRKYHTVSTFTEVNQ